MSKAEPPTEPGSAASREEPREPAGLGLTEYAEVLAHLVHFEGVDSAEVLRRLAVDPADVTAADERWPGRLADELARGELDTATTFAAAFAARKEDLAERQPALESLGSPAAEAATPTATGEPSETTTGEPGEEAAVVAGPQAPRRPAPLEPARMPMGRPVSAGAATVSPQAKPSPWAAAPEQRSDASPAREAGQPPVERRPDPPPVEPPLGADRAIDETALAVPAIDAEPLPFREAAGAGSGSSSGNAPAAQEPPHPAMGQTVEISTVAGLGLALPFGEDRSEQPPTTERTDAGRTGIDETQAVSARPDPDPALPFADPGSADADAATDATPSGPPVWLDQAGGTQEITDEPAERPLPFSDQSARDDDEPPPSRLTLAQYASLRAELALEPERETSILRRYGLPDAEAFAALDAGWLRYLGRHPEEQAELDELLSRYRAWLVAKKEDADE